MKKFIVLAALIAIGGGATGHDVRAEKRDDDIVVPPGPPTNDPTRPTRPPAPPAPDPLPDDLGHHPPRSPSAAVKIVMVPRAEESWRHWDAATNTYRRSYVYPSSYTLELNACASDGGASADGRKTPITRYTWFIESLDGVELDRSRSVSIGCRELVEVPQLGRYRVALTVENIAGERARASATAEIRDLLIVSIGDSFAAGEGNPDQPAVWRDKTLVPIPDDIEVWPPDVDFDLVDEMPVWMDERCHRSAKSGHFRAARQIEDRDPHTSITFLSFACSGSEIVEGLIGRYGGQVVEEDEQEKLHPQIEAVRDLLGPVNDPGTRAIDAFFVSTGGNDVGFSTILKKCAFTLKDDEDSDDLSELPCATIQGPTSVGRFVEERLDNLPDAYDSVDAAWSRNLLLGGVYVTEYPAGIFTVGEGRVAGGCGLLSGINSGEASWLTRTGRRLNSAIRRAAIRNGWFLAPGLAAAFSGHGYCANEEYFRGLRESIEGQLDHLGTAHPNRRGHIEYEKVLAGAFRGQSARPPVQNLTVTFERLRVHDPVPPVEEIEVETPTGKQKTIDLTPLEHPKKVVLGVVGADLIRLPSQEISNGEWFELGSGNVITLPVALAAGNSFEVHATAELKDGPLSLSRTHRLDEVPLETEIDAEVGAEETFEIVYTVEVSETGGAVDVQPHTTSDVVSEEWFSDAGIERRAAIASLQTFNGSDPAVVRLRTNDDNTIELAIEEEGSKDAESRHVPETVSALAVEPGLLHDSENRVIGEAGSIDITQTDGEHWRRVPLRDHYDEPVVLAQIVSRNGDHPAHTRLRDVRPGSFKVQIEEWDYLDQGHVTERVAYLVLEAGFHELNDGRTLQAGRVELDDTWAEAHFAAPFKAPPAVVSRSQTFNGPQAVVTRHRNVEETGFEVHLQEEEGNDGRHATEFVGFVAVGRS